MGNTEVETIGVRLTLDAAGFAGGADKATSSMNAFTAAAERAVSGAGQMKALGGAQVAGGGRSVAGGNPAQMAAVNVPLMVNAESLATLRAQIIKGLGSIPINITPTVSKAIAAEAKAVVSAVSTPAIGTRSGAARAVETAVRNNLPTRAHGGPVEQGRPVVVGEKRPEVYIPRSSGTIHPDAERYYREQARLRKREAELAALEYQQQQQHDRQMGVHAMAGRRVARLAPPAPIQRTPSPANAERRRRGWDMAHAHGNMRGWENAQWRAQEAAEKAEDAMLVRYDAERTRWSPLFPSSNTHGWKAEPQQTISNTPVNGDPLSIWGDEHRAHGGPAHKGGLPRGYSIEFFSPRDESHQGPQRAPSLALPSPNIFKSIKKPVIKDPWDLPGIVTVVKKGQKVVATFPFSFDPSSEVHGVPTPFGSLHPEYSLTDPEHRRKGLANAAYVKTERFTGRPVAPSPVQLTRGKALWAQSNRPFGKIFGERPVDLETMQRAAREEANDQSSAVFARRQAAAAVDAADARRVAAQASTGFDRKAAAQAIGAALSRPGALYCPTCGTASGPYTSQTNLDVHMSLQHGGPPSTVAAASRASAPMFGQPFPTRGARRPRRNDPQEQMRGLTSGLTPAFVDPWAAPAHVPQPAPVFGDLSTDRLRSRGRGGAVEISRLPGGGGHYASRPEGYYRAIQDTIAHYQDHSAPGGYVGVAPIGRGTAVQLHGPGGEIESWRILRNLKHAGFGALAYRATMENEGGTFPLAGGPQPSKGYAVGIQTGTAQLVPANNPRAFLRAFHEQRRAQTAAGGFPPFIGTWLHEGQIHIDPAAVMRRKREGDLVARAKAQMAFFDLKRFEEIPTSSRHLRATAERIQQLIMSGRRRMAGGPVENVSVKNLLRYREIDRESHPRYGRDFEYLDELTETIRKEGIKDPLEVWYSPGMHAATIADGNHRLAVARRLGMETVPTTVKVPRSSRLRGARRMPGDPHPLSEGFYAPSEIGLRMSGGPVHAKIFRVSDPNGLHMRPAGRLQRAMGDFTSDVSAVNLSNGEVLANPRSLFSWEKLHARKGDRIHIRADGEDSKAAIAALGGVLRTAYPMDVREANFGRRPLGGRARGGAVEARMSPEELDYVGNLRTAAANISPEQLKFGKVWYSDAQKWIKEQARRYGIDPTTARGVTAALSAGTAWGANKAKAHKIFSTHGQGLFGESFPYSLNLDAHRKAKAIVEGADPWSVLGHTPKVGQFYRNLGGDLNAVTLDRWAFRTATRGHLSEGPSPSMRRNIDAAYRKVAAEVGLNPVELQAAAWLYERETNPRLGKKGKPQSLGQLESMFGSTRAMGGLVHTPSSGLASGIFQTAADWANDPFMAIMAWQQQQAAHKARGGDSPKGLYIVGEIGKELFVPDRLTHLIPKKVMDQIPKAHGGMQVIGQKPNSLFSPPEDGIIVPNRLMDQVPHAARGTRAERMRAAAQEALARADVWSEPGPIPFLGAGTASSHGPGPFFGDKDPEVSAIQREERMKVAHETATKARAKRAYFMPQRENEGEQLAVMRAGAAKTMPSRTPAGAVAAIGSFLFGGVKQMSQAERDRVEAQTSYNRAFAQTNKVVGEAKAAHAGLTEEMQAGHITTKDLSEEMRKFGPRIREVKKAEAERLTELTEKTAKSIPTTPGVLKNLGVIIGATTLYGMAMQAASTVITDAALPAMGKFVDEVLGFGPTATRITTDLAKATQAGNVTQSMAQAASTAGLGTAGLAAIQSLIPSVIAKAGAAAAGQAMDLRRAALGATMGTAPTGLYGGTGGLMGSSLFAEQLGGTKGFLENISGEAAGYRSQYSQIKSNPALDVAKAIPYIGPLLAGSGEGVMAPDAMKALETEFSDYNQAVQRGATAQNQSASTLKLMTKETLSATKGLQSWDAATGNLKDLANQIGGTAPDEVKKLLDAGGVIVDSTGKALTNVKDLNTFLTQAAQGAAIASPEAWAKTNLRQLYAQTQARQIQQQRTMSLDIPFQITQSLLSQPVVAPGLGFFPGAATGQPSATAAGMTGPAAGMAQQALAGTAAANVQLTSIAGQGMQAAFKQVMQFNPTSLPEFASLAGGSEVASAAIAGLTTKMGTLNQEANSFNWANQIRLATRSLGDALGAISGAGVKNTSGVSGAGTQLGVWQGMSHKLDIMNQTLSLQLQQRQITTALAQAQFMAPGQTGEERYYAQVEAIQKAAIAQKQQGIGVQQLDLGQKIWNENANRAALDASKAITSMQLARNAEGFAITAQENIAKQEQILATKVAGMNAILGTATGNWNDALSAATQGIGQFAGSIDDGIKAVYEALGYTKTTTPTGATVLTAPASGFGSGGTPTVTIPAYTGPGVAYPLVGTGQSGGGKKKAAGFLGSVSGPTQMIVGEAGTETVAILANPRTTGGSNGPSSVELTSTNITSWMRAIQISFPKVGLTDPTIESWVKALQGGFPAVDLSDKTIAALSTAVGTAAGTASTTASTATGGKKAVVGSPSTTANLPANQRLDRFAAALSKDTGLTVAASRKWAQAEVGPLNNLGIMAGPGKPAGFATPEAGASAAADLIKSSSYYSGIMKTVGQSANTQLNAIARSPWHLGPAGLAKAGGVDPYYARIFGLASGGVMSTLGPTGMIVGEANRETVAVLRNPRSATVGGSSGVGPMNLTVNITGTSVRSNQDITDLARQVAAEVEKTLARKGQMFGLRGPAV